MDHGADHAEVLDRAFQLVGGGFRRGGGQGGETLEAVRINIADCLQAVVGGGGDGGAGFGVQLLPRRRAVGQDLHVDIVIVHGFDARRAGFFQGFADKAAGARIDAGKGLGHLIVVIMLFDGDNFFAVQNGHDNPPLCVGYWSQSI